MTDSSLYEQLLRLNPFPKPKEAEVTNRMKTRVEVLRDQVVEIDQRLAEIKDRMSGLAEGSYESQELSSEERALLALRLTTANKIESLTTTARPTPEQIAAEMKREFYIREREREMKADSLRFAEKLAKEGDHRNARLWRMEALRAREHAERELGVR